MIRRISERVLPVALVLVVAFLAACSTVSANRVSPSVTPTPSSLASATPTSSATATSTPTAPAQPASTKPAQGVRVFPPGPCGSQYCLARFEGSVRDSGGLRFRIATAGFYSVSWFLHPAPGTQCSLTALSLTHPDGTVDAPPVELMQDQTTISSTLQPGDYVFQIGVSGCFWRVLVQAAVSPY